MGKGKIFVTGDIVPLSGLYVALHSTPHKLIESELCFEGTRFRKCRLCPLGVLYRLEGSSVRVSDRRLTRRLVAAGI
jgi:hypothetical protein